MTHTLMQRPPRRWRMIVAGGLALVFFILDRASKAAVLASLTNGAWSMSPIPGLLRFQYVENTGAAFSLGEGQGWLFVLLAVAVLIASAVYLWRAPSVARLEVVGLGMVAGGAVGNAIDRVAFGYVVDFIATEFIDFPVFNVADIAVTVGVAIACIGYIFFSPAAREVDASAELNARDEARRAQDAHSQADKTMRE